MSFQTCLESAHANCGNGQVRRSDDGVTQQDRAGIWDVDLLELLLLLSPCRWDFLLACGVVSPLVCQLPRDTSHDGLRMLLLTEVGLASGNMSNSAVVE